MNPWLSWVGAEHYPTIDDYCSEAADRGVSKRLPTKEIARSLMEPGTVVFLAHDEGKHEECPDCLALEECGPCRGTGEDGECSLCLGIGKHARGSGGLAILDGEPLTVRALHAQRSSRLWVEDDHDVIRMACDRCGGRGHLPVGYVFGLYVPAGFEFILPPGETDVATWLASGFSVKTVEEVATELERGCGKRKPGGVYAVTRVEGTGAAMEALGELVEAGKVDLGQLEVHGDFVRLLRPHRIYGRRHRGVARWVVPESMSAEVTMVEEALEISP